MCVFITNDIINKFGQLPRNRISNAIIRNTGTIIQTELIENNLSNRNFSSDLIVSLKIVRRSLLVVCVVKKGKYVFQVKKTIFFKGKIFNNKKCGPTKEFLLNFFKLLFRKKKSTRLSQQKLESIFKIQKQVR